MKRLTLILSDQAETDLVDIWVYIAEDSPDVADAFIERLYQKCQLLADNPELGRRRPELGAGLRSFPFRRYMIYYRAKQHSLEIARILSAYRDLDSFF